MESNRLTRKLVRQALLFEEYDFQVVYRACITNLDADGLSGNPILPEEDLTGKTWHEDRDREAFPGWHAAAYLTSMSSSTFVFRVQSLDEESNRAQIVTNV